MNLHPPYNSRKSDLSLDISSESVFMHHRQAKLIGFPQLLKVPFGNSCPDFFI
jgi:hypothetical protein